MSTRLLSLLVLAGGIVAGCASPMSEPSADVPSEIGRARGGKADGLFEDGPLYLTGAFDGSRAFRMWIDTIAFARSVEREQGQRLRFTYFINTAYYDRTVSGSAIGTAATEAEGRVRWAITQQAANEGHEIGDHTVRHKDGGAWSYDAWKAELNEFHALVAKNLFEPVFDSAGKPLFPRWRAAPGVHAGAVGASCSNATQCDTRSCAMVSPEQGFCSRSCSTDAQCGAGLACGGICLPVPEFPVYDEAGAVLFDAHGNANLANPRLKPYRMVGFRAPQLAANANLFTVLSELGYRYDTSQVLAPGAPARTRAAGQTWNQLFQFGLMRHPGTASIPMDYNYLANDVDPARMLADYKQSIVHDYEQVRRVPWNIGHHFSLWKDGGYWRAMQDAFLYAAAGCVENGVKRCPDVQFMTFRDLADQLEGKGDAAADLFEPSGEALPGEEHSPERCEEVSPSAPREHGETDR